MHNLYKLTARIDSSSIAAALRESYKIIIRILDKIVNFGKNAREAIILNRATS